ncbi:MAG: glycine--tRNA ligase [Bacteroidia bacterium]|nr:glycine--tRNA ligase [Bacteroidia bacterium]MDW8134599.1 glycine--tRNA ligase [Bacteroidia bacterium]
MGIDIGRLAAFAKEQGFIYPGSELYEGIAGVYDYGPLGVELKRRIADLWWRAMIQLHENIVGLDAAILMHPRVWEASGHVEAFHDPLVDNKVSKKRYRVDTLIEEYAQKLEEKARKEIEKLKKKSTASQESLEEALYQHIDFQRAQSLRSRLSAAMQRNDWEALSALLVEEKVPCPESGSTEWTPVRQFNLMFSTHLGAVAEEAQEIFLRPETAQGVFVDFPLVVKTARQKLPFGIAQIGKAFRNEIVARQFLFRMREFEQMEMEFFVQPGTEKEWYEYWKYHRMRWHQNMGLKAENLRFKDHEHLSHYAKAATDIEYYFPFGFRELEGIHSRTDYDLRRHAEYSGKKLEYYEESLGKGFIPYVIETSVGLDRLVLAHLCQAYTEELVPTAEGGQDKRIVLKLPILLAPIQVAIFPLVKRPEFVEIARKLYEELRFHFTVAYEEKDSIGRRYRRYDAKGTPFAITIDGQTLEDETVTLRDRDSLQQIRLPLTQVQPYLSEVFSIPKWLKELQG